MGSWTKRLGNNLHNINPSLGTVVDPLGWLRKDARDYKRNKNKSQQLETLGIDPGDPNWQENANRDAIFDEFGYTSRLPGSEIAADIQNMSNAYVAARNDRLMSEAGDTANSLFGEAQGALDSGLNNMQAYRPGGAAAMASGLYQAKAGAYQNQAGMNVQVAGLRQTTAPDLMFRYNEERREEALADAEHAQRLNTIGQIVGAFTGKGLFGGGGQQQGPQDPGIPSVGQAGPPAQGPTPSGATVASAGMGAGPSSGGGSGGGGGGGMVAAASGTPMGGGPGQGGPSYAGASMGGGGGGGVGPAGPGAAPGGGGGGGPAGGGMGGGPGGGGAGGAAAPALGGAEAALGGMGGGAGPVAPSAARVAGFMGNTPDQAHATALLTTGAAIDYGVYQSRFTSELDRIAERVYAMEA